MPLCVCVLGEEVTVKLPVNTGFIQASLSKILNWFRVVQINNWSCIM